MSNKKTNSIKPNSIPIQIKGYKVQQINQMAVDRLKDILQEENLSITSGNPDIIKKIEDLADGYINDNLKQVLCQVIYIPNTPNQGEPLAIERGNADEDNYDAEQERNNVQAPAERIDPNNLSTRIKLSINKVRMILDKLPDNIKENSYLRALIKTELQFKLDENLSVVEADGTVYAPSEDTIKGIIGNLYLDKKQGQRTHSNLNKTHTYVFLNNLFKHYIILIEIDNNKYSNEAQIILGKIKEIEKQGAHEFDQMINDMLVEINSMVREDMLKLDRINQKKKTFLKSIITQVLGSKDDYSINEEEICKHMIEKD